MKTVFLTGSSGNMGFCAFKELYARKHMYHIVLLNRDRKKNHDKFAKYKNDPDVTTHSEGEEPYRRVIITLK